MFVIRSKFPFDKLKDKIIEVKERYGKAASLVIEEGGISHGLIQSLREKHLNVVDYKSKGEKLFRLISQIDLFEGGSVLLPPHQSRAQVPCYCAVCDERPPQ